MRDQVAIAHLQLCLQILKRPTRPRRQQGHDAQPTALVDDSIEFVEIEHEASGEHLLDVSRFPRPRENRVDDVIYTEAQGHRVIGKLAWPIARDSRLLKMPERKGGQPRQKEAPPQANERPRGK